MGDYDITDPSVLDDKIYWEDIFETMELQQDLWGDMYQKYQKLQYQGADPRLLEQINKIIIGMAQAFNELDIVQHCFVQMPKGSSTIGKGSLPSVTDFKKYKW